jgi:hypothetical protein
MSAYALASGNGCVNALFSRSSTTRVFVYEWRVYNCTLFDTFLDPQVRFDVFSWNSLIAFHQMLKYFGVRVGKNYTSCLSGCARVSPRVLGLVNSHAIT